MTIIGGVILLAGFILSIYTTLWLIFVAFRTGFWWGMLYIFIPLGALVFIIVKWQFAGRPFIFSLIGGALVGVGVALVPGLDKHILDTLRAYV